MKKLVSIIAMLTIVAFFNSCKEKCEKDKTGDITVTNNTETTLWFDVTDDTGNTNENRQLATGSSTTYTMSPGSIIIWASFTNNNSEFINIEDMELLQCATENYATEPETCSIFYLTNVMVVNNTGVTRTVKVEVTDFNYLGEQIEYFLDEQTIVNGASYTYTNVPAISAVFWIKDGSDWYYIDSSYTLNACQLFTFTWDASKINAVAKGIKKNVVRENSRPTRRQKF